MSTTHLFQKAEDEYFTLRGQLEAGRITRAQFEAALKNLMLQDAQGRWWMLGVDSGKWYVNDGKNWVEAQPPPSAAPAAPVAPAMRAPPRNSHTALWIAGCGCLLLILLGGVAGFFALRQGFINISLGATAPAALTPVPSLPIPIYTPLAPSVVAPSPVDVPSATWVAAPTAAPTVSNQTRLAPTLTLTPAPVAPKGSQKKLEPIRTSNVIGISVVNLATGATQQIYGEPNIASAAWSPDGAKILLSSDLSGQRALRIIDLAGNLINDVQIESGKQYNVGSQEALWSPDGNRVIAHNVTIPHSAASLILFDSTGKLLNIVDRRLDKEGFPLFWSVDGKWVIVVSAMPDPSPTLKYTLYAEEVATLSESKRKSIPEWQQYQQSIGASDRVFDQRYWPWVERSAPTICSSDDYFSACP